MNRLFLQFGFLLLFVLAVSTVYAGHEQVYTLKKGAEAYVTSNLSLRDQKFPNQRTGCYLIGSKAMVSLSYDQYSSLPIPDGDEVNVEVTINYTKDDGTSGTPINKVFHITKGINTTADKDYVIIDNAHEVIVTIIGINGGTTSAAKLPEYALVDILINTERYYPLDLSTVPFQGQITQAMNDITKELELTWPSVLGAEEYELEYTYVDDYLESIPLSYKPASSLAYDFKFNSTRILTKGISYNIPVIYDHGYLLYRLRAKGKKLTTGKFLIDVYSRWSSENYGPTVEGFEDKIPVNRFNTLNFQVMSTFAEEGKRKDVISYFDGSLRNRQVATKSNSLQKIIIGETIYDYEGRAAAQILPVPSDGSQSLSYQPGFNKASGEVYFGKDNIDKNNCNNSADPLYSGSGAGKYYSNQNTSNAYVPDAGGYPYTQTEFEPDNTGRVRRQSGLGPDFKLGSNHETQYFYGKPEQIELDRLFGTNAGNAAHYKKNMVVDPNGIASVSYVDPAGKTIATAIVESTQNNLLKIDGADDTQKDIVVKAIRNCGSPDPQACNTSNNKKGSSLVFSKEIIVTANTVNYKIDYSLNPVSYNPESCPNLCYECLYDLDISIKDECGASVYVLPTKTIGGAMLAENQTSNCGSANYILEQVSVDLSQGTYTLVKTLTVNKERLEDYISNELKQANCLSTLESFKAIEREKVNLENSCEEIDCKTCLATLYYNVSETMDNNYTTYVSYQKEGSTYLTKEEYESAVETCEDLCNPIDKCEASYKMMLADLSPGGQYGSIDDKSKDWALSVFNNRAALPANVRGPIGRTSIFNSIDHKDNDGHPSYVLVNYVGKDDQDRDVYEPEIAGSQYLLLGRIDESNHFIEDTEGDIYAVDPRFLKNLSDLAIHWQASWAKEMITYHPEYCYYSYCIQQVKKEPGYTYSSNEFDERIQILTSYQDAILNPSPMLGDLPNPIYDARFNFSGNLINLQENDSNEDNYLDLVKKDPYFKSASSEAYLLIKAKLKNYKKSGMTVKQYASLMTKCGGMYYASGTDLDDCKDFMATTDTDEQKQEQWENYSSFYLSEKESVQEAMADQYCLNTPNNNGSGINSCIGNSNYIPYFFNYRYWNQAGISNNYYKNILQPCSWWSYRLYRDKVQRFTRHESLQNILDICDSEDSEEVSVTAKRKGELEQYMKTGQCPLTASFEGFMNDAASRGWLTSSTSKNLLQSRGVSKGLYEWFRFYVNGLSLPTGTTNYVSYAWYPQIGGTDFVRNYEIKKAETSTTDNNPTTITLNFGAGQSTNYVADGHTYKIDLSFKETPKYYTEDNIEQTPGRFTTKIKGIRNVFTLSSTPTSTFIADFVMEVYDNGKLIQTLYNGIRASGSTNIQLNRDCDFSTVCEVSEEAKELRNFLSVIAANGSLSAANLQINDDSEYGGYLTNANLIKYLRPNNNIYTYSKTSTGIFPYSMEIKGATADFDLKVDLVLAAGQTYPAGATLTSIKGFSCLKDYTATTISNDFELNGICEIGGAIQFIPLIATVTIYNGGTAFAAVKCGPPTPYECKNIENENRANIQDFLIELITDNRVNTADIYRKLAGNTIFKNGEIEELRDNRAFMSTLSQQLGLDDYRLANIQIVDNNGAVNDAGNRLTAGVMHIDDEGNYTPCELNLTFVNQPPGITFANISDIANLKADYNYSEGGKTYHFTAEAIYYNSSLNNWYSTSIKGSSCFPVANCDLDCALGMNNLVSNGNFDNPNITPLNGFKTCYNIQLIGAVMSSGQGRLAKSGGAAHPGWWSGNDRTNKGYFLIIDAAEGVKAWYQEIDVVAGEYYKFKGFCRNLNNGLRGTFEAPSVKFYIRPVVTNACGTAVPEANVLGKLDRIPWKDGVDGWTKFEADYLAPVTGKVEVGIFTYQVLSEGNDLGIDEISFSKICRPDNLVFPELPTPTVDDCKEHLNYLADVNAELNYDRYIKNMADDFRNKYTDKCLSPVEKLTFTYPDKEYHHTLYYYDQAGNLVKTVPPQGVDLITDETRLDEIFNDRFNKTFTNSLQPQHTLITSYNYNSLNQLVSQDVPDHAKLQIFSSVPVSFPSGYKIQESQFKDAAHGYLLACDGTGKSHLFITSTGGTSWSELTKLGILDVKDVQFLNANKAFAVGTDGGLLKTINAGTDWTFVPVPTSNPLIKVIFADESNGTVYEENGTIWVTSNGGDAWVSETDLYASLNNLAGKLKDVQIKGNDGYAIAEANGKGYIYKLVSGDWQQILNIKTSDLFDISMINETEGFAAGTKGIVLKTMNAGNTWEILPANLPNDDVKAIHFVDKYDGSAICGTTIFYTRNGGLTWTKTSSFADTDHFEDYYFESPKVGYTVSNERKVYKTFDGGRTWLITPELSIVKKAFGTPEITRSVHVANNKGVVGADNGKVYKKEDLTIGGDWTELSITSTSESIKDIHVLSSGATLALTTSGNLFRVNDIWNASTSWSLSRSNVAQFHFTSATNGYLITKGGVIYTTINGGAKWDENSGGSPSSGGITAIAATSAGYITVGTLGRTFKSNQDLTTFEQTKATPGILNSIGMLDASNVFITGNDGQIYKLNTTTGGFEQKGVNTNEDLLSLDMSSSTKGAAGTKSGKLFYTTTSGDSWIQANLSGVQSDFSEKITDITFKNLTSGKGFANGSSGTILVTQDYGQTWALQAKITQNNLNALSFIDGNTGLAVGDNGTIIKTGDGSTWVDITTLEPLKLKATHLVKGTSTGYAVGEKGTIVKTTDAGLSWKPLSSGVSDNLYGVWFKNEKEGFAVGDAGLILKTTTGGSTWSGVRRGTNLKAVHGADNSVVAVGDAGLIVYTNNFGTAWSATTFTSENLKSVAVIDNKVAYAAGTSGTIIKAGNGFSGWSKLEQTPGQNWTTETLNDIDFTNLKTGYVTGANGTFLKTIDAGLTWAAKDAGVSTNNISDITFLDANHAMITTNDSKLYRLTDFSDKISSRFWYDELGRLVVSQNVKQSKDSRYSYTRYDVLGRIVESGEIKNTTDVESLLSGTQVEYTKFENWVSGTAPKYDVTKTYYDAATLTLDPGYTFAQENLRNRVAAVTYQADGAGAYDHASRFSYDVHGNVKSLLQEYTGLRTFGQQYKTIDYDYDLISGKVNEVVYQKGQADQFMHKYEYDAENRITSVATSRDGMQWAQDATYSYYDHGPLARTELGDLKVQGLDYTYTLQGWIKAVNANTLAAVNDPGKDSYSGGINSKVAKDVFSYSLGYYENDYTSVGTTSFLSDMSNSGFKNELKDATNNKNYYLYNGNISSMVTTITDKNSVETALPQGTAYLYDQLNRIKQVKAYSNLNAGTNAWETSGDNGIYASTYKYDNNGNIVNLTRKDQNGAMLDNLDYKYDWIDDGNVPAEKRRLRSNRLYFVDETAPVTADLNDLEDDPTVSTFNPQPETINTNNSYQYDEIGNLIKDKRVQSDITWNAANKITLVNRSPGSDSPVLRYLYDAQGNRMSKAVIPNTALTDIEKLRQQTTSWYVRDFSGNVMAVYEQADVTNVDELKFTVKEMPIYGNSRLAELKPEQEIARRPLDLSVPYTSPSPDNLGYRGYTYTLGKKYFELNNHLGNVLTVISDQRQEKVVSGTISYYLPRMIQSSDYYPFGMIMGGRGSGNSSMDYRYGFNGQEKVDELHDISGDAYDYGDRVYDTKLGRWLSMDKLANSYPSFSPYNFVNDNPILNTDVKGQWTVSIHYSMTWTAIFPYISVSNANLVSHYVSLYADHPSGFHLFLNNITVSSEYPIAWMSYQDNIDYSKTSNSQVTDWKPGSKSFNYNIWHSMQSPQEGISRKEAMMRGMKFGWGKLIESAEEGSLEDFKINSTGIQNFGQGLHALQDAYAHQGCHMDDHSVWNDMANEYDMRNAQEVTNSAVMVHKLISGSYDKLPESFSIITTGMSDEQLNKVNSAIDKYTDHLRSQNKTANITFKTLE